MILENEKKLTCIITYSHQCFQSSLGTMIKVVLEGYRPPSSWNRQILMSTSIKFIARIYSTSVQKQFQRLADNYL
jgi:hypothetical protein